MNQEEKRAPAGENPPQAEDQGARKKGDRPLTPGQQRRRQRSVLQYITILFGAAFVLLLFTFLMERRQYQLLNQQNEAQIDDLQQSVTAVQSLSSLYEENAALKEEQQALEEENQRLTQENEQLRQQTEQLTQGLARTSAAMDWFWQIDEAYVRGSYSLCRSLIGSLEEAGLKEFLPKESVTDNGRFSPYDRYQEIYDALF